MESEITNNQYKNILVIALRKIGDTIIATAGISLLRKAYPDAKITVLVKPLTKDIVKNNPVIDEVMLYDYSHKAKWADIKAAGKAIRAKNFDLCIVLDNKVRSALLAWLSGIPKRVGFERLEFRNAYLKLFYTDIIKIDYDSMQVQQAKNHEIFINRFTKKNGRAQMVLPNVGVPSAKKIAELLKKANPSGKMQIALCLRSGCKTKDWRLEYFKQTVEMLAEKYAASFIIIGAEADIPFADEFIRTVAADVQSVCGKTTLPELGFLLHQADFFLSVDTGSAHIGAAAGVPLVVMFGSTSPKRWGPYTQKAIYLAPKSDCHPCDGMKKNCQEPLCLDAITPQEVFAACSEAIERWVKK
jgi:lipopolysaccharide heptosyltransferase II